MCPDHPTESDSEAGTASIGLEAKLSCIGKLNTVESHVSAE